MALCSVGLKLEEKSPGSTSRWKCGSPGLLDGGADPGEIDSFRNLRIARLCGSVSLTCGSAADITSLSGIDVRSTSQMSCSEEIALVRSLL